MYAHRALQNLGMYKRNSECKNNKIAPFTHQPGSLTMALIFKGDINIRLNVKQIRWTKDSVISCNACHEESATTVTKDRALISQFSRNRRRRGVVCAHTARSPEVGCDLGRRQGSLLKMGLHPGLQTRLRHQKRFSCRVRGFLHLHLHAARS